MNILDILLSIGRGGNNLKLILTLRYLLVIAILAIPFQGLMASGCELPMSDSQVVSSDLHDTHTQDQQPASEDTAQHSCCDETTCPEMDSYCGSCMQLASLTSEAHAITSSKLPEFHSGSTTTLVDLAPPPPTKPPV